MPISKIVVTKERLREYLLKIIGELIQIKENAGINLSPDAKESLIKREMRLDAAREDILNALSLSGHRKEMLKEETLGLLQEMFLYEYKFKKLYRTMFGRFPRTTKEVMDDMAKAKSPAERAIVQDYMERFDDEFKAKLKRELKIQRELEESDPTHKSDLPVELPTEIEPPKVEPKKPIGLTIKKKPTTETPEQERERKVKERLEYEARMLELESEENEYGDDTPLVFEPGKSEYTTFKPEAKENICLLQKLAHIALELDRRKLYAEADKIDKIIEKFNLV